MTLRGVVVSALTRHCQVQPSIRRIRCACASVAEYKRRRLNILYYDTVCIHLAYGIAESIGLNAGLDLVCLVLVDVDDWQQATLS